jgi:hypothetical protein
MTAAGNISFVVLIVSARMLQSCSGQPADLKCSLLPCRMESPATLITKYDCMNHKHQFPIALSTAAMIQRDYDDCVSAQK